MPRVLRQVDMLVAARSLTPPGAMDDPVVQAAVEAEARTAYARGLRDGEASGRADQAQAAQHLSGAIATAMQQAGAASAALADHLAVAVNQLAIQVARAVVGELDPSDSGILARVDAALRVIDDRPLVLEVSEVDLALVREAAPQEVEVVAVTDLAAGEARARGRWADADLTWAAVWASVEEALDVR